jgi:hypothetical protein
MTDSRDQISGPRPEDQPDDPDSQTFFEDEPDAGIARDAGEALGDRSAPNAGYTGGLAEGNQGAVGMRQTIVDEAMDRRRQGSDDEPPANLAQQDQ